MNDPMFRTEEQEVAELAEKLDAVTEQLSSMKDQLAAMTRQFSAMDTHVRKVLRVAKPVKIVRAKALPADAQEAEATYEALYAMVRGGETGELEKRLKATKVGELKQIATIAGMPGTGKANKDELIHGIRRKLSERKLLDQPAFR